LALLNFKNPAKEFESSPYPPTFKIPDQCRDKLVEQYIAAWETGL
jgi:hypothetical protein